MTESAPAISFKAGYVAIVGEPNVGKSTLMNALLGQKISIVTRRPQTTRQRVLGIWTDHEAQMVFLDTPGLLQPHYLLHEKMMQTALRALDDADVILVLTEPRHGTELPDAITASVLPRVKGKPLFLGINKADRIDRNELLPLIDAFSRLNLFRGIIPLSALKGENLDRLKDELRNALPVHPPFYPEDSLSEQPERFFVAELIREAIFEQFQEEIPYSTAVELREYKEREAGKTYINADIVVERDSQKGILIGKRGAALKRIGQTARKRIEEFVQCPVFLELHVKVGEQWRSKESWMRRLGYEGEQ